MKNNQKGVTLISLTIYIIALTVIIAMLSVISTFFYKNVNETQDDIMPLTEFTNFNTFFSEDANAKNITYLTNGKKERNGQISCNYISLVNVENSKVINYLYVKDDKTIYRQTEDATIPIVRNVTDCDFVKSGIENNKTKFIIKIKVGDTEKEYTYNLDND